MEGPGYYASPVLTGAPAAAPFAAPTGGPAASPAGPPAAAPRSRTALVVVLLLVLALVATAGWTATRRLQQAAVGTVLPVDEPASAAAGWSPIYVDEDGAPARWDPCEPVHYVVQAGWIPDAGRTDLAEALRRISAATGLVFVAGGDTDELPSQDRAAYQPDRYGDRWAPLLVGWVPAGLTDVGLGNGVQGVSSSVAVPSRGGPSLVSGQVVLDASNRLAPGFGAGTTDGEVLLHELAHAVGLGHVLDPTQVMYPQTTSSESQFGAGDRAGLAALGAPAGCHPAPEARAVSFD